MSSEPEDLPRPPLDDIDPDIEGADELIPKEPKLEAPPEKFDPVEAKKKLDYVLDFLSQLTGGDTVSGKIYPVLDPKNWKTTTFINEGQIYSILAMLSLYYECPEEAYPCLDWCYDLCHLSLSRDGFGIARAIELGKALTEKGVTTSAPYTEGDKPTEGMKDKG